MEFVINVLRVNDRKPLPDPLRENLLVNGRYLRRFDVWLFEGDWETELWEWIDQGIKVENLGEIVLETTGIPDKKLEKQVEHLIPERKRGQT